MNAPDIKQTPMIKQYMSIKEQYKDAILFYRMGDFYEMFFQDAEKASKILDIALTSRNKGDDSSVPMCGVPVRAAQTYIARLIENGCKVAVCEQMEDPSNAKGLVERAVVRVITPGMIIEDTLLKEKTNNYIAAVSRVKDKFGVSYLDISTGTFRISELSGIMEVAEEIRRYEPSEILFPEYFKNTSDLLPIQQAIPEKATAFLEDQSFDYDTSYERLNSQFKTISLEGFGCEHMKAGIGAAGAILDYIRKTQKQAVEHLTSIETYTPGNFLQIDDTSCRNLELFKNIRTSAKAGTLINVIDRTITPMGARMLREWVRCPSKDIETIQRRLDAVEEAKTEIRISRSIRANLRSICDLERLASKIAMGYANARDLIAVKRSLQALPAVFSGLCRFNSVLFQYNENLEPLNALADIIEQAIREDAPTALNEGGIIKDGYDPELDELIQIAKDGKNWLARMEAKERKAAGINTIKVRYNKVFGYYIEIPKSRSKDVPAHYIRRQTLANAERYITDELKEFESKVLNSQERRAALEYEIFDTIRRQIVGHNSNIQKAARFVARTDCILNLAEIAEQNDYCRPKINTTGLILIEEGRHPVVEKMITAERFVPNTVQMDDAGNQILIITGPNMAGKSTVLRQVALIVIMAHMGSFVPAKAASITITDRIFTRVGALDNLSQGQSTFMVEMQETANILHNATSKSLIVMDEIGRGTSTFDGLSIAWAVAEYLHDLKGVGAKTLFATHYHELTSLAGIKPRVKNFNIAVKEIDDEIIFLRKLIAGGTNRSYGIQVARLAGIPEKVIRRAKSILSIIEANRNIAKRTGKSNQADEEDNQLDLFRLGIEKN